CSSCMSLGSTKISRLTHAPLTQKVPSGHTGHRETGGAQTCAAQFPVTHCADWVHFCPTGMRQRPEEHVGGERQSSLLSQVSPSESCSWHEPPSQRPVTHCSGLSQPLKPLSPRQTLSVPHVRPLSHFGSFFAQAAPSPGFAAPCEERMATTPT